MFSLYLKIHASDIAKTQRKWQFIKPSYHDQIQMQLALTCQSFCDFIFYTNKGMVIDRVEFDESAWSKLSERVLKFYFNYLLDNFILREEKEIESALFNDDIPLLLFLTNFRPFLYLLKAWKKVFRGYRKGALIWNGLINV